MEIVKLPALHGMLIVSVMGTRTSIYFLLYTASTSFPPFSQQLQLFYYGTLERCSQRGVISIYSLLTFSDQTVDPHTI